MMLYTLRMATLFYTNFKEGDILGSKYTERQAAATAKYMKNKHTIRVVVSKEKADEYKAEAKAVGKSLNQFVIDCIENRKREK